MNLNFRLNDGRFFLLFEFTFFGFSVVFYQRKSCFVGGVTMGIKEKQNLKHV